jgi:hypothetical protein
MERDVTFSEEEIARATSEKVKELLARLKRGFIELKTRDLELAALRVRIAIECAEINELLVKHGEPPMDVNAGASAKAKSGDKIWTFAQLMEKLIVQ